MYHVINTIVKFEHDGWKQTGTFAEKTMREILRPAYWTDQLNTGLPKLPHSRFMRLFCRQMSNLPDSTNRFGASEHFVYLVSSLKSSHLGQRDDYIIKMPYLHWERSANFNAMTTAIKASQEESTYLSNRDAAFCKHIHPVKSPCTSAGPWIGLTTRH